VIDDPATWEDPELLEYAKDLLDDARDAEAAAGPSFEIVAPGYRMRYGPV